MITTLELINQLKTAYSLPSDYAVCKKLGVSRNLVNNYKVKGSCMDDTTAVKVAELLELDPFEVIASMHFERAQKKGNQKELEFWKQYIH